MTYYDDLKHFLDSLDNPPSDLGALIKDKKWVIGQKGYGTPELEMKFLHKVFLFIQKSHPEFESFSWQQCNRFNDNYNHFEIAGFTLNNTLDIDTDIDFAFEYYEDEKIESYVFFDSIDSPDPDEIEFAKQQNIKIGDDELEEQHWNALWEYKKQKYKHLETPCLKMITFLKLLDAKFSMYYFLYTFGNGVKVYFDKEGVTVTGIDESEVDGDPLGNGMRLEEL